MNISILENMTLHQGVTESEYLVWDLLPCLSTLSGALAQACTDGDPPVTKTEVRRSKLEYAPGVRKHRSPVKGICFDRAKRDLQDLTFGHAAVLNSDPVGRRWQMRRGRLNLRAAPVPVTRRKSPACA